MILTLTWLAVLFTALALYLRQVYSKLSQAGINHRPVVPLFGHFFWMFFKKEHAVDAFMKSVEAFPEDRFVGHYDMVTPTVIVTDVELIKKIGIKDFDHFVDRRGFIGKYDPLFGRSLLLLTGDEWKAMRSTLSPAFTSSKIKLMVPFMVEVGEHMLTQLKKKINDSGKGYIDLDTKDMATRYANDVIASCAFGLSMDSQTVDNQFYLAAKQITTFNFKAVLKVFLFRCLPSVATLFKVTLAERETIEYLTAVVLDTMKTREEKHIVRHDMINILMDVKKGQLNHDKEVADVADAGAGFATVEESSVGKKQHDIVWSDTELVAQAALFLFAGFDTVSTAMSFILHELTINPEVQKRLVEEIREHDEKHGGKINFNSIQNLTYLDMVVSEGMRLWPPAPFMDRTCVKDYNLGKPNSTSTKDVILRKGDVVIYPIWALHHNPDFFPDPLKFDPERFSPENRDNIKPFTYLPFGIGPRNCIGSRFALCEVKVMLYQLLLEMELYPCEKTPAPARLCNDGFNMKFEGGSWARVRVRSKP